MSKHMAPAEARQLLDGQTRWLNIDDVLTRALNTILYQAELIEWMEDQIAKEDADND